MQWNVLFQSQSWLACVTKWKGRQTPKHMTVARLSHSKEKVTCLRIVSGLFKQTTTSCSSEPHPRSWLHVVLLAVRRPCWRKTIQTLALLQLLKSPSLLQQFHCKCGSMSDSYDHLADSFTRHVIVKLLSFTFAMILGPIGTYFLSLNTVFGGMSQTSTALPTHPFPLAKLTTRF